LLDQANSISDTKAQRKACREAQNYIIGQVKCLTPLNNTY